MTNNTCNISNSSNSNSNSNNTSNSAGVPTIIFPQHLMTAAYSMPVCSIMKKSSKPRKNIQKSVAFTAPQQQQQQEENGGTVDQDDNQQHDVGVSIHHIERWQDMSKEERSLVWFSRRDFDDIKLAYKAIILRMRNKELLRDTDEVSTRGLECRSVAGSQRRRDAQINGLVSVLGEQARQRKEQVCEPETLAVIYRQYSYHCQQAAANMGRRDEYAVLDYLQGLPERFMVGMSEGLQLRLSLPAAPVSRRSGLGLGGSPSYFGARSMRKVVTPRTAGGAVAAARRRAAAA